MSDTKLQDRIAAGINHAIAYRCLYTFQAARERAENDGADLSALPDMPSMRDIGDRYERLIEEWIPETPDTAAAVRAFVDFATLTLVDHNIGAVFDVGTIMGEERDREHAIRALLAITGWLVGHENAEFVAKRQAADRAAEPVR